MSLRSRSGGLAAVCAMLAVGLIMVDCSDEGGSRKGQQMELPDGGVAGDAGGPDGGGPADAGDLADTGRLSDAELLDSGAAREDGGGEGASELGEHADAGNDCLPGTTRSCTCPQGASSVAVCTPASVWTDCICDVDVCTESERHCWCEDGRVGEQVCDDDTGLYGDCVCLEGEDREWVAEGCVNVSVDEVVFRDAVVGDLTSPVEVEIENCGDMSLLLLSFHLEGDSAASFEVTSSGSAFTHTCVRESEQPCVGPEELQPGDVHTLWVRFMPVAVAEHAVVLAVFTNVRRGERLDVRLSGNGLPNPEGE